MHFGENQLSRNLIGLSPLTPGHPLSFQPKWVRSSTRSYPRFNLPRARSSRFGSRTSDSRRLLRLAFATHPPQGLCSPPATDSQTHFSIGTPSPPKGRLRRFVSARFQELFHSPPGVLFTFPSRYWFTIGQTLILRLTRRSGLIHTGFHEARATREQPLARPCAFGYGAITLYGPVSNPVHLTHGFLTGGTRVGMCTGRPTTPCAQPPTGITRARFSLIRFRSPLLTEFPFLQVLRCFTSLRTPQPESWCRPTTAGGFPHSDTLGSKPCRRLPEDYRGPTRPSSALSAKASTTRPYRHTRPQDHTKNTRQHANHPNKGQPASSTQKIMITKR